MKIKKSAITLLSFDVIAAKYMSVYDGTKIEENEIDIDFKTYTHSTESDRFKIRVILDYNKQENFGHVASIVCESEFKYKSEEDGKALESQRIYSCLPMTINSMRMFLETLTCHTKLGKIKIPFIDIKSLVNDKFEQSQREKDLESEKKIAV